MHRYWLHLSNSHKNAVTLSHCLPATSARQTKTEVWPIRLVVLLSLWEGRGIMPAISSPKHVPTGAPCLSVSRKKWSVLGFYPGAPTQGRGTPDGICVQCWNDFMLHVIHLIIYSEERKRQNRSRMEAWRGHAGLKTRLLWENCSGHHNTSSNAMMIHWTNLIAATMWGLISLCNVSERKKRMFVYCSVVRAKIIMSQRKGGWIKRPFVSS